MITPTRWVALAGGSLVFAVMMLSSGRADAADPCSLLSPDQVASALGVPEVKTGRGTQKCQWVPKKYAPGPTKDVWLSLENDKGFAAAHLVLGREVTPVKGIGDEAVQTTTQGTRTVLTVKKGNVYFAVRVTGLPVNQAKAAEQVLAKQVIARL